MTEKELQRLHQINLDMAKFFVEFCRQENLMCYFCGGGCIGAVRHKGMIPWDDDLDFFMPREDYQKAIELWKLKQKNSRYVMEVSDAKHVDHNLFFTIRDTQTTYIKPYQKDLDIAQGVVLDVLPIDGYPDGKIARKIQCFWALIYSLYCSQLVPENHGKVMMIMGKIALFLVPSKKIRYHIWKYAEKQMTRYPIKECRAITELCSGPYYMRKRYPKEAFEKAIMVPFEDTQMPIPVGYDSYLRIAFGDYMRLPPVEKRIGHHDACFMDLEKGYLAYKGIKYCVKK